MFSLRPPNNCPPDIKKVWGAVDLYVQNRLRLARAYVTSPVDFKTHLPHTSERPFGLVNTVGRKGDKKLYFSDLLPF